MKFSTVLFDFDGTLVDSSEGVINSAIYSLLRQGIEETDRDRLCYLIGPPLYSGFSDLYPELEGKVIENMIEDFHDRYDREGLYESRVYDGIEELLISLKDKGIRLGIASAKPEIFLLRLLKHKGILKYFEVVSGVDMDEKGESKTSIVSRTLRKMKIEDKSTAIMVGDRKFDVKGAHGAGIKCIGILYGFGSREEFEEAGANFIAEDVKELEELLIS